MDQHDLTDEEPVDGEAEGSAMEGGGSPGADEAGEPQPAAAAADETPGPGLETAGMGVVDKADAGNLAPGLDGCTELAGGAPAAELDPLTRDIEALLFVSPEPLSLEVLAEVTGVEGDELVLAVETVRDKFPAAAGGIVFTELAGGYALRTNDDALPSVERLCQRPADYTLSAAAMETLAIVAYLQPITRPEIARIRGIGADTVVANLLEKGLLMESGRADETGAVRYRTTRAFEKLFGLADLSGLPAVEGFDASPQDVEELRQKLHLAADKRQ